MRRKTIILGIPFLVGIFAASFAEISVFIYIAIAACGVCILAYNISKQKRVRTFSPPAAAFCLGVAVYSIYFSFGYGMAIRFSGSEVRFDGAVTEVSIMSDDRYRYIADGTVNDIVKTKVTLWSDVYAEKGDKITVSGRVKTAENSYTFASADYSRIKGIYLQFSKINEISVTKSLKNPIETAVDSYREHLFGIINKHIKSPYSYVFTAMVFGDRTGIDADLNQKISRAGLSHIMAVSGAQLAVICSVLMLLLDKTPIHRRLKFFLLLPPLAGFILLAEDSSSITRSAVMILITYSGYLFNRRSDTANSLVFACVLMTVFNPFLIREASFLMSVGGVYGVAVLSPQILKKFKKNHSGLLAKSFYILRETVISSAVVSLVLFPVTFFFFDEISIVSPITNIVILPLSSIAIVLGMFFAATGGVSFIAVPVLFIGRIISRITIFTAELFGGLSLSYIPTGFSFELPLLLAFTLITLTIIYILNKPEILPQSLLASFGAVLLCVWVYRLVPSENLYIAVLGDESSSAVVIHDKFSASVTDFSGGDVSASVKKYLNGIGISDVSTIIMNKNSARALPVYIEDLSLMKISGVSLPKEQDFYNQENIVAFEYSMTEFDFGDYTITPLDEGFYSFRFFDRIMMNVTDTSMSTVNKSEPQIEIYLSGTDITPLSPEIIIAGDSAAQVWATTATEVFIGHSAEIKITPDGKISSRILF
ncbi:MAG: ComEC/Rec2 family competence protein [Ruminococcus sp.]|jgi:ComEC/Rec2-related protein|nr:ComEC/Rec2 family competence protein [Ruminococcus sp.]